MYLVYLDDVQLPVAPSKIERKIKNQNKTFNLINESEINIPKLAGLSEISFTCSLPVRPYPFANYPDGFKKPAYYSMHFGRLKSRRRPFDFRIIRFLPTDPLLIADSDFLMKVTIEDYTVMEDAKTGPDIEIAVKLKEFRDYGAKLVTLQKDTSGDTNSETDVVASVEEVRPSDKEPSKSCSVKSGDGFWAIAQRELGDGNRWSEIVALNKDGILKERETGNSLNGGYLIHPGDTLILPEK